MKIGLYFGSFNPIHTGHLIIANHILNESELNKIWFVVSPQNPFKQASSLLNEYDRLFLVEKAIEGDDRLKVSNVEFSLPKPSYTSHTLAYLSEKYPANLFTILMGSDSFQNIGKWKNASFILKHYPVIVYRRPNFDVVNDHSAMLKIVPAPLLEISATHIREAIRQGKSVKYLLPETVKAEIEKSGFYKAQKK